MLTISALYIYPVKSARGVSLDEMALDERGAVNDRRWMVADEDNIFLSQRQLPRLSLIAPALTADGLRLEAPGMPAIDVRTPDSSAPVVTGTVWDGECPVRVASPEANAWVSTFLGRSCRLLYQPDDSILFISQGNADALGDGNRRIALTDGAPLLLIGEASLADLNGRLTAPLPMNRFRPNIVVRGGAPFAEDSWKRIEASGISFEVARPCPRCATTTVDQETGERGLEPLRTLATFRKVDSEVMFGQNVAHNSTGRIRVGSEVRIVAPDA